MKGIKHTSRRTGVAESPAALSERLLRPGRAGLLGAAVLSLLSLHCGEGSEPRDDEAAGSGGTGAGASGGAGGTFADDDLVFDSGGDDGPDAGGDPGCGTSPFGASRVETEILVVADKSGSMSDQPVGFETDKWTALAGALEGALSPVQGDLSYGLGLFPSPDACSVPSDAVVDVAAGADAFPLVSSALGEVTPSGGTPTAAALSAALAYFTTGAGAASEARKYVLLATDGGPTCNESLSCEPARCVPNLEGRCPGGITNCCDPVEAGPGAERGCLDDAATLAGVEALRDAGILTFVVGIPGSEIFADSLDAFAVAGGAPNQAGERSYFAVDDPGSLSAVLESITRSLVTTCRLQLESVPPALDRLNVEVEGEVVPRDGADGWTLDDSTSPPTLVLQGATCERVETDGVEFVGVVYGCPTVTIQ